MNLFRLGLLLCLALTIPMAAATPGMVVPFPGFPDTGTSGRAGEYVLTPSYQWLVDAEKKGADKVTFIFYTSKMVEPGTAASRLESFGRVNAVPNSMFIPIPAGGRARKGEILLSWWQTGSGMQRCYVVNADNPAQPEVVYLDIDWTNPAKGRDGKPLAQSVNRLKPDSFYKLDDLFARGTTIAVRDTSGYTPRWRKWQVITVAGGKVLALGFAGRMAVFEQSACRPLPVKPSLSTGMNVHVPYVGSFVAGVIKRIDQDYGRVICEITWGGKTKEIHVPFGDVATGL